MKQFVSFNCYNRNICDAKYHFCNRTDRIKELQAGNWKT